MVTVDADELSWLLFSAVRYSIGRMSYAPALTAEIVLHHKVALTRQQRDQLAGEIRERLVAFPATYDRDTWQTLADELEKP